MNRSYWKTKLYACWCILRGRPVIFKAHLRNGGIVATGGLVAYTLIEGAPVGLYAQQGKWSSVRIDSKRVESA